MNLDTLFKIRQNPNLYQYLKYNSYWYKLLNRDPILIKEMDELMKKEYKLTAMDKINNFSQKIDTINTFLDILK